MGRFMGFMAVGLVAAVLAACGGGAGMRSQSTVPAALRGATATQAAEQADDAARHLDPARGGMYVWGPWRLVVSRRSTLGEVPELWWLGVHYPGNIDKPMPAGFVTRTPWGALQCRTSGDGNWQWYVYPDAEAYIQAHPETAVLAFDNGEKPAELPVRWSMYLREADQDEEARHTAGKWCYTVRSSGRPERYDGIVTYDGRSVGEARAGDTIMTPWGLLQFCGSVREWNGWFPEMFLRDFLALPAGRRLAGAAGAGRASALATGK